MNTDRIIAHYVALRDEVARLDAEHKKQVADLKEQMNLIEAAMQIELDRQGATSIRAGSGTAYKQTIQRVHIEDWDAALAAIVEAGEFGLLEKRLSKNALAEYVKAGNTIPGASIVDLPKVNIRRS